MKSNSEYVWQTSACRYEPCVVPNRLVRKKFPSSLGWLLTLSAFCSLSIAQPCVSPTISSPYAAQICKYDTKPTAMLIIFFCPTHTLLAPLIVVHIMLRVARQTRSFPTWPQPKAKAGHCFDTRSQQHIPLPTVPFRADKTITAAAFIQTRSQTLLIFVIRLLEWVPFHLFHLLLERLQQ